MSKLPLALHPPDTNLKIRPVRLTDAETLQHQCWPDRSHLSIYHLVMRAQQNAKQGRGLGIVVMGEEVGLIKGYGQLTLWPNCGEISDLVVPERYRGQGIGTGMIQYLVRTAREMHVGCVEIGAALSNAGAVALYRRLGFEDSHTMQLDVGDGRETVLFLRMEFGANP
jgi:ribosomal protein S18 acetylase RimI-like enzyme